MEESTKLSTISWMDDAIPQYNVSKPSSIGRLADGLVNLEDEAAYYPNAALVHWCLISSGLKRNASMTLQLCMVSLIGGFKDNDSTLTDSHLKETDEQPIEPPITRRQKDSNYRCQPMYLDNLVIRHRVEDFQLGIESYQTQLNLTKPRWEATGFEFKHDYTVIDSPRAVTFRDRYGVQMIMRIKQRWKWRHLIPVESIHHPMLTLKFFQVKTIMTMEGWMSAELVSSLSLSLGSFSTTADGIGGPSYEALLHVVIALASFLGFGMVLLGNELELEACLRSAVITEVTTADSNGKGKTNLQVPLRDNAALVTLLECL
ncbi:hypothetical protein Tco_0909394 [Tanacetum coccineum]|uniref:Uncharacterized protein n=1 Tax=Tanacetum coccineum TaxID=301880 RepID=A0ABQ5CQW6_9ASTR